MYAALPFNVDVTHFITRKEGIVLQDHLVCVPNDHPQLESRWFSGRNVDRQT